MFERDTYDVAIIGGGLAGLSAAILLVKAGHTVALIEKDSYPRSRVCGEYVSMESWGFLKGLGLPLEELELPRIDKLVLTAPNGLAFNTGLPLGGFGISRELLDHSLANIALAAGLTLFDNSKVEDLSNESNCAIIHYSGAQGRSQLKAKLCLCAYGKRSNLDVKWKRPFLQRSSRLDQFVGVKYHLRTEWPTDQIGLHNFEGGYAGISRIENGLCCFCYMTRASAIKGSGNSIAVLEKTVLARNSHLKKILDNSVIEEGFPVTISQINFNRRGTSEKGTLMLGDSAGLIAPLCGNGMSMALHSGKMAAGMVSSFLEGNIDRQAMIEAYTAQWNREFASRLRTGRIIQGFFGASWLSNSFVRMFRAVPALANPVIRMTHGRPF